MPDACVASPDLLDIDEVLGVIGTKDWEVVSAPFIHQRQ
jgi:hypothetical protein